MKYEQRKSKYHMWIEDFCEYLQSGYHFDKNFYKTIVSVTECY